MKKGLFVLFIILSSITVIAQSPSIGIHAGITLASQKTKFEGFSLTSDHKVGFTAGAMLDIPLVSGLSIQPALNFVQKGGKYKADDEFFDEEATVTLNYLEVPVNVLYNINAGPGKVFFGLGPSFAFGLSGKTKFDDDEEKIKFGSDDDSDLKRLDVGINFLAGYRLNPGVVVTANFTPGLSNLSVDEDDDVTQKNSYFGFTIGYFFNK